MRFIVPQFIDVKPKIIGPITPRQFIILIVTGLLIFASYKLADFTLFLIEGFLFLVIGVSFAFVKVKGRPLHEFFLNVFVTVKNPSLRIWKKEEVSLEEEEKRAEQEKKEKTKAAPARKPLSSSHLSQIALVVNTGGKYEGENRNQNNQS